jgi:hypothetical protein
MSSKVSDFLHELIHSLTKSEKRYFKLLSSRHTIGEENNYILLFDFIDKQEIYDEMELKLHFKGESFLNKLSITKKRLYDHILNALDNFHSQSNIESQIFKMIHSAEILSHKTLYAQAKKTLISAEKLAEKNELTNILIHIRTKFKVLLEKNNYIDIQEKQLLEILKEDESLQDKSRDESNLWNIKSQLFQHMALHGVARTDKEKVEYDHIFAQLDKLPNIKDPNTESIYLRNHIKSAYFFSIQDMTKSFEALKDNLQLFKKQDKLINTHPDRYFSILTNLVYTAEHLCLLDTAEVYFAELKKLEKEYSTTTQDIDLQIKLFSTVSSIELSMLTQKGNYLEAKQILEKVKNGLESYGHSISSIRKAYLWYKVSCIQLASQEPQLALKSLRKILNDTDLDKKEDIVSFAHLLELFIYIELDDLEYLNYAARSTKRFLTSRKRFFTFEKELLSFISKYVTTKNKFDRIERWESLHSSLQELTKDPYQASGLEYFDFLTWAESRTKNLSFIELSRMKFLKKLKNVA